MAVFGSGARGELRPDSDVDVLVEFEPGVVYGLGYFGLGMNWRKYRPTRRSRDKEMAEAKGPG